MNTCRLCYVCGHRIWGLRVLTVCDESELILQRHRTCGPGSYEYTRKFPDTVASQLHIQRQRKERALEHDSTRTVS